jgi:hypothetical protein
MKSAFCGKTRLGGFLRRARLNSIEHFKGDEMPKERALNKNIK